MKIVLWGKGERSMNCLSALHDKGYKVELVVGHPEEKLKRDVSVLDLANRMKINTYQPEDPNNGKTEQLLNALQTDLFVLAGYGKILKQNIIGIPKIMCINLHAGQLPQYRGSSPLNWALINEESTFNLTIEKVNEGVDTGDILLERTFKISINDTIRDLQNIANRHFPLMLLEVVRQIEDGSYVLTSQDNSQKSYYPLRFPDDGFILWDMYTSRQVHNHIRALTIPYPCAFTFFKGRRVNLLTSELYDYSYFGEPGRIYRKSKRGLLVCAKDRCLWIKDATFLDSGERLIDVAMKYDKLSTVREALDDKSSLNETKIIIDSCDTEKKISREITNSCVTINLDKCFSDILGYNVYSLVLKDDVDSIEKVELMNILGKYLQMKPVLIYTRICASDSKFTIQLEDIGFHIVETNAVYLRDMKKKVKIQGRCTVRNALSEDRDDVCVITEKCFRYSRFHNDPNIDNQVANSIKVLWVSNYFLGKRGDKMVVAEVDNIVVGFLLLLYKEDKLIVDLIAVDSNYRRENIASDMIAYVAQNCDGFKHIQAATQLINVESIKFYEKNSFRFKSSSYAFHYHNK